MAETVDPRDPGATSPGECEPVTVGELREALARLNDDDVVMVVDYDGDETVALDVTVRIRRDRRGEVVIG